MSKKALLTALFSSLILITHAQLFDDFSDGNFTHNPVWEGDTVLFKISDDYLLQLNAEEAGDAVLSTRYDFDNNNLEWRFTITLGFAPSANNYAKVYLMANSPDLRSPDITGYFLRFGENGSEDAVELYYQDRGNITLISRGTNGTVASPFSIGIKVTKNTEDHWQTWIDQDLNGFYQLDSENYFPFSGEYDYLGIFCRYTAGNSKKFYFDDFYSGPPVTDTVKPSVQSVRGSDDLQYVMITFDKNVSPSTALDPSHYYLEKEELHPSGCYYREGFYNTIILQFNTVFQYHREYLLTVSSVEDPEGNIMELETLTFYFYYIQRNDLLIHEIMADPSPPVGLPESEYVELFNTTEYPLTLEGWKLQIGKNIRELPVMEIPSEGFAIIVSRANLPLFREFSGVYAIPSMSIANAGQEITLLNNHDEVIHTVRFSDKWHSSSVKRNGGWALEMVDYRNPCGGAFNWQSSISGQGGTPGKPNSVYRENPDLQYPEIERISLKDSVTLKLFFTEPVFIFPEKAGSIFTIDRNINIIGANPVPPDNKLILLTLSGILQPHLQYTLSVTDSIWDCTGLTVPRYSSIIFGVSQRVERFDLVINEILTHPPGEHNSKYIEIYNRSEKIIDLSTVRIGSGGDELPEKSVTAVSGGYQLLPGNYAVLCANKEITRQEYYVPYPERLIQCDSLPNYAQANGSVHLTDQGLKPVDRLIYEAQMHYELLKSTKGIALEKINFDLEIQHPDHWKSAAATAGFGTPGYRNSQYTETPEIPFLFNITPEIFSPDSDGFDDFALFSCQFPEGDNRVSISIYDRKGNLVRIISNNILCGTSAHFTWDGTTEKKIQAPPDIYIVIFEYWNSSGVKKRIKKVVGIR